MPVWFVRTIDVMKRSGRPVEERVDAEGTQRSGRARERLVVHVRVAAEVRVDLVADVLVEDESDADARLDLVLEIERDVVLVGARRRAGSAAHVGMLALGIVKSPAQDVEALHAVVRNELVLVGEHADVQRQPVPRDPVLEEDAPRLAPARSAPAGRTSSVRGSTADPRGPAARRSRVDDRRPSRWRCGPGPPGFRCSWRRRGCRACPRGNWPGRSPGTGTRLRK